MPARAGKFEKSMLVANKDDDGEHYKNLLPGEDNKPEGDPERADLLKEGGNADDEWNPYEHI